MSWDWPARQLYDRLRAYTPWPGLVCELRQRPLRLSWGEPVAAPDAAAARPGEYLGLRDGRLVVRCGDPCEAFGIETLQRPGRRPLAAADFINGERLRPGERFG